MYEVGEDNFLKQSVNITKLSQEMLRIEVVTTVGSDGHFRVEERPKGVTDDQIQAVLDAHDPTPLQAPPDPRDQKLADLQAQVDALAAKVDAAR